MVTKQYILTILQAIGLGTRSRGTHPITSLSRYKADTLVRECDGEPRRLA
jgi:hypothetical protein